jgi:hypothetical protein
MAFGIPVDINVASKKILLNTYGHDVIYGQPLIKIDHLSSFDLSTHRRHLWTLSILTLFLTKTLNLRRSGGDVNFTNILRANFSYETYTSSFYVPSVKVGIILATGCT